jgi:hypothetical protein
VPNKLLTTDEASAVLRVKPPVTLRPWEQVPNIRAYYSALLRQILSDTFFYFWSQLAAGVVVALLGFLGTLSWALSEMFFELQRDRRYNRCVNPNNMVLVVALLATAGMQVLAQTEPNCSDLQQRFDTVRVGDSWHDLVTLFGEPALSETGPPKVFYNFNGC